MKKILMCLFLFLCINECFSQKDLFARYSNVDVYPTLKEGGEKALQKMIDEYQTKVHLNGEVCIEFLILPNGKIGDSRVIYTNPESNEDLKHAAIMFGTTLPEFTPGILNDEKVRTWKRFILKFGIVPPKVKKNIAVGAIDVNNEAVSKENKLNDKNKYDIIKEPASFPGGNTALLEWLKNNMHYPNEAIKNNIKGKVYVEFIVEADGTISNVTIKRSVSKELDEEAARVVKAMPLWNPTVLQSGKKVRVKMVLPITFTF